MPAPETEEMHQEVVEFNCPRCRAVTGYSAADGGLTCTHCGYYEPPKKAVVGKGAEQFEFTVATLERAAHGWGDVRKELQCQNCGVYTSVPAESLTHTCPFCGSNKVIQREAPQDVLRPRYLIPFKIEAGTCHQIAHKWMGSSWMTPTALRRLARVAEFRGVYLPFWTFDAITEADWRAEVGHTETERYYSDGEWKTRTKTVWKWESGHVRMAQEDIVISGTTYGSQRLLSQIQAFDLRQLAPYEPKFLAGYQAQSYDVKLEKAWEAGRQDMRERTRQNCHRQASSSKIRNFSMQLDFNNERWRYILLPVYVAAYHYDRQTYQVLVNGQTGAIAGQRPVDWGKVWLAVIALLAPGATIALIGIVALILGRWGFPIAVIGFVMLVIGIGIAVTVLQKAQKIDDA